jgi:hypothetical protein
MANHHLLDRLEGIQKMLMGVHAAGASMSASSKGQERQQFIDHFLAHALPPIYRFGSGDATDASGHRSGQLDVVIEHPFAPNLPIGAGQPTRLYLAEAVAAVVEVKSDLAGQWEEAKRTANAVAPLRRNFALSMSMGQAPSPTLPTYIVGYTGWKKIETLQAKLAECPAIAGILIIEDGLFCAKGCAAMVRVAFGDLSVISFGKSAPSKVRSLTPLGIWSTTLRPRQTSWPRQSITHYRDPRPSVWQPVQR